MKDLENLRRIAALLSVAVLTGTEPEPLRAAPFTLDNDQVTLGCEAKSGRLLPGWLRDKSTGQRIALGADLFSLVLTNKTSGEQPWGLPNDSTEVHIEGSAGCSLEPRKRIPSRARMR